MSNKQVNTEFVPEFDDEQFTLILESQKPIIAPIKELLKEQRNQTYTCFKQHLNTHELIQHRARVIDALLIKLWMHFNLDSHALGLLAVGGYGRGELHPYSDIDLLIICKDAQTLEQAASTLQDFITLLWDLNLDIGHSVRTLTDCQTQAKNDLTIITNLLESRPLRDKHQLHTQLKHLISTDKIWPADEFFHAKWDEIKARHDKHKRDEYNLEPDIKNAAGTLRDIQTITWVTARLFGEGSLEALLDRGFLTQIEYQRMQVAREFLWTLRFCLHMLAQREEDRLLFDWRESIIKILHIQADESQSAIEKLMRQFYRTQLLISEICDLLLLHFNQDFLKHKNLSTYSSVNQHFALVDDYLQITDPKLFEREPHWLLEVFLLMANTEQAKGIHSDTIRALRENRHLIDKDFRDNLAHNKLFMQILSNHRFVVRELSRMMRYGILGLYIPEFGKMIGWMDHDLLNVYTVEVHTFKMIRLLRRFRLGQDDTKARFGLACEIVNKTAKKELLYLAALLHKTGKSQQGEEIENSVNIAQVFCIRHNLKPTDSNLVIWLIKNQNLLQQALQNLDISHPEDIHHLANQLYDQYHLDALYLFSVANIETTNPKLWTSFRAEQMNDLYKAVKKAIKRGLDNPIDSENQIAKIKNKALIKLEKLGFNKTDTLALWGNPGKDYFLREGVDNLVWQTQKIMQHSPSNAPLVRIKEPSDDTFEGGTEVFIFMPDTPSLFAVITAALDQLNLNIQDARIMVSEEENNALDIYTVLDEHNQSIRQPERLADIQAKLEHALADTQSYSTIINRKTARALKQFNIATQVTLSNLTGKRQTCLNIIAADRPGILAKIGAILNANDIHISNAKILTEGERINDTFFVSDKNGNPLTDSKQCEHLKQALIEGLDEQIKAQSSV